MASGFGSLRRLNELRQKHYGLSPTALRKKAAQRAIPGVETVKDGCYMRTVCVIDRNGRKNCGWVCIKNNPEKNRIMDTLSDTLVPVLPQILARIRRMFDLHCSPDA